MTRLQKSSSSFCKRLMTNFPIQRIENFTISMVRTGALAAGARAGGFHFNDFDVSRFRSPGAGPGGFDIFEEMFGGGRGRAARSGRGRDIEAELETSLEEAHRGGRRTLQMQVTEPCPTCGGTGVNDGHACDTCGGAGEVTRPKTIEVNIPAGARDGSTIRIPGQGGRNIYFD